MVLITAACQTDPFVPTLVMPPVPVEPRPASPTEPRRDVDQEYFAGTQQLFFVREVLVLGGRRVKHGREVEWYRSGGLRHERFYSRGEPAGLWRSWYESGSPRAAVPCDLGIESPMTWWYENGRMSSHGMGSGGLKQGPWKHWYESGALAEEGSYANGLRQGAWTLWYASGALRARGSYRSDVRVGDWQWWAPDGRLVEPSETQPPPGDDAQLLPPAD